MAGRLASFLVATAIVLAFPAAALAAPPANDAFVDAEELAGSTDTASGTNVEATKETGEPDHADDPGGASVWYEWTAPTTDIFRIETCESDFDTLLAVYTGDAVDGLAPVASNDQGCGDQSRTTFAATMGTTYRIAVDGYSDFGFEPAATGLIELNLQPASPPSNDNFADATTLDDSWFVTSGSNLDATAEPNEPDHADNPAVASIWYEWTPAESGRYRLRTCESDFDTVLAVYTGSTLNGLNPVVSNDDGCGDEGLQSQVLLDATAGTTYRIAVDGFFGEQGSVQLTRTLASPPPNDNFGSARNLGGGSTASATGTNLNANKQPGEPDHAGDLGGASVWYRWTAPSDGRVDLDVCGSNFDTLLGVYRGSSLSSLITVAGNDDACGFRSAVSFNATAGTTYRIAVDGYSEFGFFPPAEGTVRLALSHTPTTLPAAPDTQITKAPKKKTSKRTTTFEFISTKPGSTFECSIDGKGFKPCSSPHKLKKLKAKKGKGKKHSFEVRAIDSDGRVDQTPAEHDWKVKKKGKKKKKKKR